MFWPMLRRYCRMFSALYACTTAVIRLSTAWYLWSRESTLKSLKSELSAIKFLICWSATKWMRRNDRRRNERRRNERRRNDFATKWMRRNERDEMIGDEMSGHPVNHFCVCDGRGRPSIFHQINESWFDLTYICALFYLIVIVKI